MKDPYRLGKRAVWPGAAIGLLVTTVFGFLLGVQLFSATTRVKLAADGYVARYFQGPGKNAPCTAEENNYLHIRPC